MIGRKHAVVALAATCLAASAAPAFGEGSQTLYLDLYNPADNGFAGPVSTSSPLAPNVRYQIKVKGTYSLWPKSEWLASTPCGNPLSAPMFPSPAVSNGPVGVDAETVFASTGTSATYCQSGRTPSHVTNFQMNNGTGFQYQTPIGGPYSTPRPNHTYKYILMGSGSNAFFSFRAADTPTSDNYGQLQIKIHALRNDECSNCGGDTDD